MNAQHKAVRALLTTMSPNRATRYIKYFHLPEDEENVLLECDVRGKSYSQVCAVLNMSPETLKKKRRRAYAKIVDELNHL